MKALEMARGSSVGQKMIMAFTGVVLFGWTILHMVGNLLVFWGPSTINGYGALLQGHPLVWVMRFGLLALIGWHGVQAWVTWRSSQTARTSEARPLRRRATTWSARTMRSGGLAIGLFVVYHLLHIYGVAHGSYVSGDVYHNVVHGFRAPAVTAVYLFATIVYCAHIRHGLVSAGRSLGITASVGRVGHRTANRAAMAIAVAIGIGFAAPCIAVISGVLR